MKRLLFAIIWFAIGVSFVFLFIGFLALPAHAGNVAQISGIVLTDQQGTCPPYHREAYDEDRVRGCWTVPRSGPRTLTIQWEDGRVTYVSEMQFELYGEIL